MSLENKLQGLKTGVKTGVVFAAGIAAGYVANDYISKDSPFIPQMSPDSITNVDYQTIEDFGHYRELRIYHMERQYAPQAKPIPTTRND